jgi:hypothetical protein
MPKALLLTLVLVLAASAAPAQTYHANDALGERLVKTPPLSQSGNAGGKNILENSCIYKNTFALSASEDLSDRCDIPREVGKFVSKYGQADQVSMAPGGKQVLEYFLKFKENDYHVKVFIGCAAEKTEVFAMVECVNERNRVMPGGPPGKHGGFGGRRL